MFVDDISQHTFRTSSKHYDLICTSAARNSAIVGHQHHSEFSCHTPRPKKKTPQSRQFHHKSSNVSPRLQKKQQPTIQVWKTKSRLNWAGQRAKIVSRARKAFRVDTIFFLEASVLCVQQGGQQQSLGKPNNQPTTTIQSFVHFFHHDDS